MHAVAAIPAIGVLGGAAVGLLLPDIPFSVAVALLIVLAVFAVCTWRVATSRLFAAIVCAAFLVGGAMLSADAWAEASRPTLRAAFEVLARRGRLEAEAQGRRLPEDEEAFAIVTGVLRSDAAPAATGVALTVDVDSVRAGSSGGSAGSALRAEAVTATPSRPGPEDPASVSGGIQATVVGTLAADYIDHWRAGRRVRMPVQLRRPSRYLNPGVPDFERALARRGTTLVGTVKSGALVELVARGGFVDERAAEIRAYARHAIHESVGRASDRSAAIVSAIVIGDRTRLDEEVERRLQEAGTYHVIAISGGNIAILAASMLAAFRWAGMLGRTAMLSAIGVLLAYARLVGGGASVDRATLMAVVYFAARALDQRSPPLNTLAFVAACLAGVQPLSVVDPAFLLTFGATLAILLVVPLVRSWRLPRSLLWPAGLLAASVATEIALLPVGALAFSRVTFAGLALNFAAIPLMAVAQIAGMAVVSLALVSTGAASVVGYVAHLAATGLVRTADLVELVPGLALRVAPPGALAVGVYYLTIATARVAWRQPLWRRSLLVTAALAAVWIVAEPWAVIAGRGDGRMHVTFLDVGQGDAAFVRLPRGTTLLVDTGGLSTRSRFDIGERVVAPTLRAAGVKRLDAVVLTHGDPDHVGGAASLIQEFRAREVWEGIEVPSSDPLRDLRDLARVVGARWVNRRTGDRVRLDGVDVDVRHPGDPDWERQRVRNDDSLVLELRWRDISVLLTGDIGRSVEHALASTLQPAALRVVKVPHHGSLTSSSLEFVRAVIPTIAVVSAGRSNHFGHPVPEVLRRYREVGAEVFRTDQDGAVTIDTDGQSIDVHTFTGRRLSLLRTALHHEVTKGTKP